jgi:hypothetical protein
MKNKPLITVLLSTLLLSSVTHAEGKASEGEVQARCSGWTVLANYPEWLSRLHRDRAAKTLDGDTFLYEAGIAQGMVLAISSLEKISQKEAAHHLYINVCSDKT